MTKSRRLVAKKGLSFDGRNRYTRALVEMSNEGILVFGQDRSVEFANQMASLLTGHPGEQLLGKKITSILGQAVEEVLEQLKGPGDKLCQEVQITTARGDLRDVYLSVALVDESAGEVKGCAYLTDITERKKFEKQLKTSEKRYRELFQRVGEGLFISGPEGKFVDCNQALLDMLGYQNKEEFLEIDIARDLYVNPEERRIFQKMMERDGHVKEWEAEFKRKDGGKITVLLSAHAIRDGEGKIVAYEGINIDITQRKKLERELRDANDFLRNLIESSVDGIIVADTKGNIIIFNQGAEALTGYKAEEVIGKMHITQLYPPGVAKEVMNKLRSPEYGGSGKFTGSQFNVMNKHGEVIPIHLSAATIYQDDKEVASVGIFTDLRHQRLMEKKLQETQLQLLQSEKLRSLGEMAAGVAHEINNPLGGILIYASLLMEDLAVDDSKKDDLHKIVQEATRCKEIVKSLLEFSRQSGPKMELTDVNRAIIDGLLFLENQATFHNIEILKELDPFLPPIWGNAGQLKQVFMNIIVNAADAMQGRGTLTIKTYPSEDDKQAVIEFTDTGQGIPDSILPNIFDPFFTTKEVGTGTGLGLSMSYGIVKEHRGDIEVDTIVGTGTTFRIVLPIEYEETPSQQDSKDLQP